MTSRVTGYFCNTDLKKKNSKRTFVVITKHNYREKTGFLCVCTRLWVSLGLRWVTVGVGVGVCGCLCVFTQPILQIAAQALSYVLKQ